MRTKIANGSKTEVIQNIWGNDLIGTYNVAGSYTARYYFLKDHLGSVKVRVAENGDVIGYDDGVYPAESGNPFGLTMDARSYTYKDEGYKFTGKERDAVTAYDYFGARYYNSWVGRWLQVDPLVDIYLDMSPYTYCENNPIRLIDELGKQSSEPDDKKKEIMLPEIVVVGERNTIDPGQLWALQVFLSRQETQNNFKKMMEGINAGNRYTTPYYLIKTALSVVNQVLTESAPLTAPSVIMSQVVTVSGKTIAVTGFTEHGLKRAILRGFSEEAIQSIIKNGTVAEKIGKYGSLQLNITYGENTVVIETAGRNANKIISVFSTNPGGKFVP